MPTTMRLNGRAIALAGLYLVLWGAATGYLAARGADWTFPLISLGVFGLALSGAAWALTRKARPAAIPVKRPGVELAAVLAFLTVYAVVFLGWGLGAVKQVYPPGPAHEGLVLAVKLAVHVVAPALILAALGARIAPLFSAGAARPGFWPPLLVLGVILFALLAVVSPSLKQISGLHLAAPQLAAVGVATFAWLAVEAGLCEEFLFRAVLQSRLSAFLKTEVGAVVIGALLFALAHAPGLYLRGGPGVDGWSTDPLQVVAFTVATLSPLALLFGTLWARTRSLLLIVLLHAAIDTLPNMAEFAHTWGLAGGG